MLLMNKVVKNEATIYHSYGELLLEEEPFKYRKLTKVVSGEFSDIYNDEEGNTFTAFPKEIFGDDSVEDIAHTFNLVSAKKVRIKERIAFVRESEFCEYKDIIIGRAKGPAYGPSKYLIIY